MSEGKWILLVALALGIPAVTFGVVCFNTWRVKQRHAEMAATERQRGPRHLGIYCGEPDDGNGAQR